MKKSSVCRRCISELSKIPGRGDSRKRALDRYLGIPIVFFAGHCRRKRTVPPDARRMAMLNTAALGDTVLMSGPVADLRAAYPNAELIYLCGPNNYEAACLLEGVDAVVQLPVFSPIRAIKEVRAQKIDLFLDFGPWCRLNAIIAIYSGADFTAGFRTNSQARHFGYDVVVEHSDNAHELENQRGLIRAIGIMPSHPPSLRCEWPESQKVHDMSRRFVVFHLWPGGSAARLKEWPLGRWIALAEDLATDQYDIVFTGAASQRSLNDSVIGEVKASLRSRLKNAAGSSLRETLRLLSRADLVVSVDTGIMHMAAALRIPLIALHGPTSPQRWGPVSDKAVIIEPPMNGCGFLSLGFEKKRDAPACMNAISFGTVKATCHAVLDKQSSPTEKPLSVPMFVSSLDGLSKSSRGAWRPAHSGRASG